MDYLHLIRIKFNLVSRVCMEIAEDTSCYRERLALKVTSFP